MERHRTIETLKEDVQRLRGTIDLIEKARSRAAFLSEGSLQEEVDAGLAYVSSLCEQVKSEKVSEAKGLSLKNIGEEIGNFEAGSKGKQTRRLER